ncbi:hypothetical protein [Gallaecimonas xiamenensis]|uniref:Uncharacterized protein n=1 Tax=Gallaecimonas xiamenensis 3-C-1 TaxID=745411 RepID=K2JU57_9GAMM|nr:hypothetical protein [Gallaecimonas xiamenensis]EKE68675.1 hypothetical protein B3C1_16641 [Gallaecimonas xiamenensis 3-C-1]
MLHKWLVRLLTLVLLVFFYEQGLVLALVGVGQLVPKLVPLDWLWDNQGQPFSFLMVLVFMQPLGLLFGWLAVRFEKEVPLFIALLVAIPRPVLLLWPDWASQGSVLGYLGEPLVELLALPLWTWFWIKRAGRKGAFRA